MKKLFCALLVLAALLAGASALAELRVGEDARVANCEEYITLREEPSTSAAALARMPLGARVAVIRDDGGDFVYVHYKHETGYALRRYLKLAEDYEGRSVSPSDDERYNVNLFLSNFTEAGFTWNEWHFDADDYSNSALIDFAVNHIWFNQTNHLEWGQWGDDNVRLSDEYIPPVIKKYFGISPRSLGDSRFDHRNGCYYWQETGGHTNDGFACLTELEYLGDGVYSVRFRVMGAGMSWKNDVCRRTVQQNQGSYDTTGYGHALIDVGSKGSLSDRSTWKLTRYTMGPTW